LGLVFVLGLDRATVQALGAWITIDQFDDSHVGSIAKADTRLQHAGVAAGPGLVPVGQSAEQLGDDDVVAEFGIGQPLVGKTTLLAKRYKLLGDWTKLLGLWQGRRDLLVLEQRMRQVLP
jgi:hypothetical protein